MKNKIAILLVLISTHALAAEHSQNSGYVSGLVGPALVTSEGEGTYFTLGARGGMKVGQSNNYLGLIIQSLSDDTTMNGIKASEVDTFLGGEYVVRDLGNTGLYFGGRVGFALINGELDDGTVEVDASTTVFAFAPAIGFELPVQDSVALTLDVSWVHLSGGELDFPIAGNVEFDSSHAVVIGAGVTVGF